MKAKLAHAHKGSKFSGYAARLRLGMKGLQLPSRNDFLRCAPIGRRLRGVGQDWVAPRGTVSGADGTGVKFGAGQGRFGRHTVYQQLVEVAAARGIEHGKNESVRYSPETFTGIVIGRRRFTQHFYNHPSGAQEAQAAYNQVM
jgi:hypothetical protein